MGQLLCALLCSGHKGRQKTSVNFGLQRSPGILEGHENFDYL